MLYRRTWSPNMLAEVEATQANAREVAAHGIPDTPIYLFISNGEELPANWVESLVSYARQAPNGDYMLLEVGHYIHNLTTETIATETERFLSELSGK